MAKKYEEMTDAELDAEIAKKQMNQPDDLDQLSDAELDALLAKQTKTPTTITDVATSTPAQALYSGLENAATLGTAPSIAGLAGGAGGFVGALQEGKSLGEAFQTAKESFGQARDEAIEQEAKLAKEQPAASMVGNIAGSVLTAPFLPAKGVMGAVKAGSILGAGEAIGKAKSLEEAGTSLVAGTALGGLSGLAVKGAEKAASKTVDLISKAFPTKAFAKVSEALTGVNQKEIKNYIQQTREIDNLTKKVGGDYQEAVNVAKEKIMTDIRNTRQNLGKQIGDVLEKANPEKIIDSAPIVEKMKKVSSKLDPDLQKDDIADIQEMIDMIGTKGDKLSLNDVFKVKEYLQSRAKGSYIKDGKIFSLNDRAKVAAKEAANEAKNMLDLVAPQIKEANKQLSTLHKLEERMNPSLLKVGAPESSFLAAGSGLNARSRNALKQIGDITGTDPVKVAEDLLTSRSFSNPALTPVDTTGKSVLRSNLGRLAAGGLAGAGIAYGTGSGQEAISLGLIGAALSSPATLKKAIQAGSYGKDAVKNAIEILNNPKFKSVVAQEAAKIGIDSARIKKRLEKEL